MKVLLSLILSTSFCWGQSPDTSKYSLSNVIKITVQKHNNVTPGTKEIITNITQEFKGEAQQLELIEFYKSTFDYKVIDKIILKNLIDSLSEYGINDKIKTIAQDARHQIEYRFLGKKIKDFEFPDKNGNPIKLSFLNQKTVILELWATWCGPCIEEMVKIPELRASNPNIEFYSISLDKGVNKMVKFINKNRYEWPIVFGGSAEINKELWEYLNIVAIPKYYIIDRDGIVTHVVDSLDKTFIGGLK